MLEYLDISPDVKKALDENKPVVALESTIISHGMAYPENIESAKRCEEEIRKEGAIPATIAIIGGKMKVGLSEDELNYFGTTKNIPKASRRDIAMILANKMDGATTVATTMLIASLAGIKVFATGGIGGVHRKAQESFDISADLMELANTNVAVVCAGAKSILDIGLTLEYLETHGVPVIGYKTDDFPAFYTRKSGFSVDYNGESAEIIAKAIKIKEDLGLNGGMVIANPIPSEYAMDEDFINGIINKAVDDAESQGIRGKNITPFILSAIYELTEGKSLYANKHLVYNNACVGAKIAKELCKL
ncbi:pseudouridine-5'-phosphate glycosidase [Clostridiaceae bacterium M8S5]|nr:pseudouridine-5'-phosphate glycosidase [Clostridiaceae bacterium M8S5]